MKSEQVKAAAAGIGAAAAIAMAGVGLAFAGGTGGAGLLSDGPEITLGETTTSTTAPSEPETTFVTPPVTAERPDGFEPGG